LVVLVEEMQGEDGEDEGEDSEGGVCEGVVENGGGCIVVVAVAVGKVEFERFCCG
jgi:hypothetical protein